MKCYTNSDILHRALLIYFGSSFHCLSLFFPQSSHSTHVSIFSWYSLHFACWFCCSCILSFLSFRKTNHPYRGTQVHPFQVFLEFLTGVYICVITTDKIQNISVIPLSCLLIFCSKFCPLQPLRKTDVFPYQRLVLPFFRILFKWIYAVHTIFTVYSVYSFLFNFCYSTTITF